MDILSRKEMAMNNIVSEEFYRQYLKDKLGISTTERAIAEHEVLNND